VVILHIYPTAVWGEYIYNKKNKRGVPGVSHGGAFGGMGGAVGIEAVVIGGFPYLREV
jgi:hypothetical protein